MLHHPKNFEILSLFASWLRGKKAGEFQNLWKMNHYKRIIFDELKRIINAKSKRIYC